MREHPIPQDITGYKFHLVGNMTIKQFAELFAGVILALLFHSSNLTTVIKYPLAIFFVGFGAMLAFVPIQERPLDHWVITFLKVLYRPTKFFWQKQNKIPDAFSYEPSSHSNDIQAEVNLSPFRRKRVREYLSSVQPIQQKDAWELAQNQRVANILKVFSQVNVQLTQTTPNQNSTKVVKPRLKTRVRHIAIAPKTSAETIIFDQAQAKLNFNSQQLVGAKQNQAKQRTYISNKHMINVKEVASELIIPESTTIQVQDLKTKATEEMMVQNNYLPNERSFSQSQEQAELEVSGQIMPVPINNHLPFPNKPKEPNQLAGMIFNKNNEILTGAIVEVQNERGQVVRAVKTNPLGQFFITTPLNTGAYFINVEKNKYQFNTFSIQLTDELVPPLEIAAIN